MTVSDGGMTETSGIKYKEKGIQEVHKLRNKKGEGYINTGVKIIIAVVIGALILGGLYLLFAGDGGVMDKMNEEVTGMMHYNEIPLSIDTRNESGYDYLKDLSYTYDGKTWYKSEVPTYESTALIECYASHENMHIATVRDSKGVYMISSTDGGITWAQRKSWSTSYAAETNFYWNESSGDFRGSIENWSMLQMYRSPDGVRWYEVGDAWDKN